jgi:hypothetical protein
MNHGLCGIIETKNKNMKTKLLYQGITALLANFGTIPHAVMALFPEINPEETKFEFHKSIFFFFLVRF